MDCAHDAAEIEQAVRGIVGVDAVRVSVATQRLTARVRTLEILPGVERAVSELGYRLTPFVAPPSSGAAREGDPAATSGHIAPAYRRALWIVLLLNLGYGIIEVFGGYLTGSQALKADALDFLGDGLITGLGLVAIGWNVRWRARSALIQGLFLGTLGVGVVGATIYRIFVRQHPEAELMGLFGGMALAVNAMAALILIPHRTGDANVRAVWLFSRNDAIGNLAVVVAAALVRWTGTPWPDLVVALVIAALFLHSAWVIVEDARTDLASA
jgi:Co/Zn/Cd efflux system component/copper chaperone CopZ